MKKIALILVFTAIILSGCDRQDGPDEPQVKEVVNILHVRAGAKVSDLREVASRLDSLESAEIKFDVKISGEIGFITEKSKASANTVLSGFSTGKITKRGTIKTLWQYGVGQNLVPAGLCGQYSVSDWYEVSGKGGIEGANITYINKTGEYSGWSGRNLNNTQMPFQMNRGTDKNPEFVTFLYDIRSGADGVTPPGGHLWVPCSQDSVLLYYDIVITSM